MIVYNYDVDLAIYSEALCHIRLCLQTWLARYKLFFLYIHTLTIQYRYLLFYNKTSSNLLRELVLPHNVENVLKG